MLIDVQLHYVNNLDSIPRAHQGRYKYSDMFDVHHVTMSAIPIYSTVPTREE